MINWSHIDGVITNLVYDEEAMRFKTIAEFKDAMRRGAEIQFEWNGVAYCTFGAVRDPETGKRKMYISQSGTAEVNRATEKWCDTADEILEYLVGGDRLRDVITKVTVMERSF